VENISHFWRIGYPLAWKIKRGMKCTLRMTEIQARSMGSNRQLLNPENFQKHVYLLSATASHFAPNPENIRWLQPCWATK